MENTAMDDDSFESSAFHGSRESLTRLKSINPLGLSVDSSASTDPLGQRRDSTCSDQASTIPELTRAEEMHIKRNSALFPPIQQNEGGSQRSAGSFLDSWRPSSDIMVAIEGATGPKVTRNWDDEGLDVSHEGNRPPVDVIPSHVRGNTPDSVASSGRFRILRGSGRHRDINTGNLQRPAGAQGLAKTTRGMVTQFQFDNLGTIPDSAAGNPAENFELRASSRDHLVSTESSERTKPENYTRFAPRALLLILFLACLIGAIVGLIVAFEDKMKGYRGGKVIPDPITEQECQNKTFRLNEILEFSCKFKIDHEYRKKLHNVTDVIISKDKTVGHTYKVNWSVKNNGSILYYNSGGKTNCSSEGSYSLTFMNGNGSIVLRDNISFTVSVMPSDSKAINVTFRQEREEDNCNQTYFDATCVIGNDCHVYQPNFVQKEYGTARSLSHYMSCNKTFSDTEGHTVSCSARFPGELLDDYIFLWCEMTRTTQQGSQTLSSRFALPSCNLHPSCKTDVRDYFSPFNCNATSVHIEKLYNGDCGFDSLTQCFENRPIFTYYKDRFKDVTCNNRTGTIPVCRLGWCRDYNAIIKMEIPGVAICKDAYEERKYYEDD